MSKRYMVRTDDDGHEYLIKAEDREAFDAFIYEDGPEPPNARINGTHTLTFEAPEDYGTAVEL